MKLSDSEHDVTGAELAKIAGDYSPATISRLRRSGILKRTKGGKYNVRESLQAIIAHEQKRLHEGQHNDPVLTPLRAEHLETQIALLKHGSRSRRARFTTRLRVAKASWRLTAPRAESCGGWHPG